MNTQLLQQARVLDVDEQIELVAAIWDGIVSRGVAPPLTEAQQSVQARLVMLQVRQQRYPRSTPPDECALVPAAQECWQWIVCS